MSSGEKWMELETIMLSEVSQDEKATYHVLFMVVPRPKMMMMIIYINIYLFIYIYGVLLGMSEAGGEGVPTKG
jgi:hypothetical protein